MTAPRTTRPLGPHDDLCADEEEVVRIKSEIRLDDRSIIASYGDLAQGELARYADTILRHAISSNSLNLADDLGGMLRIVERLRPANLKQQSFLKRLFSSEKRRMRAFKDSLRVADDQVQRTTSDLQRKQASLERDLVVLDHLYDRNLAHLRTLEAYIEAGDRFLADCEAAVLPRLAQEAKAADGTAAALATEAYANAQQAKDQLSRKVHDLKLSRVIALQTLPQIRLIQQSYTMLIDKLETSLTTTIPAWKSQAIISLTLSRQDDDLALERPDTETTIDTEALSKVNQALTDAIKDVLSVQRQSQIERIEAEQELSRIEGELQQKTREA